jgi:hypothetical protein
MEKVADKLAEKLLASLKRHNPTKVRAYAGDDDARDIAVPTRRRRWSQVIEAIEARAWSRVELLDKSGAVLGYVENTEPARELQELASGLPAHMSEARAIAMLVQQGQRETMQWRDAEVTALMQAQGSVMREMALAFQSLALLYREQVVAASEVATMRATAAAGEGGGQLKELLDAAPTLLQMIPLLKGLLGSGDPPRATPSNGAAKKA